MQVQVVLRGKTWRAAELQRGFCGKKVNTNVVKMFLKHFYVFTKQNIILAFSDPPCFIRHWLHCGLQLPRSPQPVMTVNPWRHQSKRRPRPPLFAPHPRLFHGFSNWKPPWRTGPLTANCICTRVWKIKYYPANQIKKILRPQQNPGRENINNMLGFLVMRNGFNKPHGDFCTYHQQKITVDEL